MEEINSFKNVKALFFDFDNTLVSFEESSIKALKSVTKDILDFVRENYPSSNLDENELFNSLLETSKKLDEEGIYDRRVWWEKVLKKYNIEAEMEDLYEWTQIYWSIAGNNQPYEDALDAIEYLKRKGFRLGVITNSDGEWGNKRQRLNKFPLIPYFDVIIIGGENNIKPKPNPQPFILACEKLNLSINNCVMVGDDPIKDCLAAKKAGLYSILVDRENKVKYVELYADFVVKNLKELEEIF